MPDQDAALLSQQIHFLEQLVSGAQMQSQMLLSAATEISEKLGVTKNEKDLWEKMKNSRDALGEKNDSVKDFFSEMGRTMLDDMEEPREDLETALQRVALLTEYFSEYAGSLLPKGHPGAKEGKDDTKRLLGSYMVAIEAVSTAKAEVQASAVAESEASQQSERLARQLKIDAGSEAAEEGAEADPKAAAKKKEAVEKREESLRIANSHVEQCKDDGKLAKATLAEAREREKAVCEHLEKQMAQFEWDRAEFMQLALGDLFYGGASYHARALSQHARLYREVTELVPDNIEARTNLVKNRRVQVEAIMTMENIKKKALNSKAARNAERTAGGGVGAAGARTL